jgi:hypothetical protein
MIPADFLARVFAELAIKLVVAVIEAVGTSDFAQDITHALYARWHRSGFLAALASALGSVWQALRARVTSSFAKPRFHDVEWSEVLAAAGGVYHHQCGAVLDRAYYFVEGTKGSGGYPVFSAAAQGLDRSSGRWLAAIPMHCGGTAGITHVNVFAATKGGPVFFAQIRQGMKSSVFFTNGRLHVSNAVWAPGEPNCRWSGTRVVRYDFSYGEALAASESTLQTSHFLSHFSKSLRASRLRATTSRRRRATIPEGSITTRLVGKRDLKNGMRGLVLHVQDADGAWCEQVVGPARPESEIDNYIANLVRSGRVHGTWPLDKTRG